VLGVKIRAFPIAEAVRVVLGHLVHGIGFRVLSMLAHATPSSSGKNQVAAITAWLRLSGPA
jgi:hypothetical protein